MPKMIFVNLPVRDLAASTRFYEALGLTKNPQFSDGEKCVSMVWSDAITIQLLTRQYFATFSTKPITDSHATCAAMFALTLDSREDVDRLTEAGAAAGGQADVRKRMDMGWLYNREIEDPDGHVPRSGLDGCLGDGRHGGGSDAADRAGLKRARRSTALGLTVDPSEAYTWVVCRPKTDGTMRTSNARSTRISSSKPIA